MLHRLLLLKFPREKYSDLMDLAALYFSAFGSDESHSAFVIMVVNLGQVKSKIWEKP